MMGSEVHQDLPEKYKDSLYRSELFNASMHWDFDELVRWEERLGTSQIREEPWRSLFKDYYLARGYPILGTLVKHPPVSLAERPIACSVVNQRGVIVYDGTTEHLFLRSYFHSKGDAGSFSNFAPRGGIKMSFATRAIWFPLALTSAQLRTAPEPVSYVVLDILTPEPVRRSIELPHPFRRVATSSVNVGEVPEQVQYDGRNYHTTRIAATLSSTNDREDFVLRM